MFSPNAMVASSTPYLQLHRQRPRFVASFNRATNHCDGSKSHGADFSPHSGCSGFADAIRSTTELVNTEYADLELTYKLPPQVGRVRTRQHVNPLSSKFSVPAAVPDWDVVFKNPALPLVVDIGCGSGRFLLWLAKRNSDTRNYLGLEIRKKLVERANCWLKELTLHNIHFVYANATVSFQQLISSYPGRLMMVFILCPDPHFKTRHQKRRVVQKALVESIVSNLASGGQVLVQSDVHEVALDMRNHFDNSPDLQHVNIVEPTSFPFDKDGWLLRNPMGIRTEREIHAELEGSRIYRRMYVKRP
ncbi:hypothetical protein Droror1_Dr00009326 [Drosera rotundifolia]